MNIKDLAGLSEPIKKLIEVIAQGVGSISKPYLIRKTADAKAYEMRIIAETLKQNQEGLKSINYSNDNLKLISLDDETLKNDLSIDERSQKRLNFKEQRRQQHVESITQKATINLLDETDVSDEKIDDDWINRFFNYAEDVSNDEIQELWARILAGEVKKPKSFSLRTLELVRNLSMEEAMVFTKVAKYAIKIGNDSMLYKGDDNEILNIIDVSFNEIVLLQELGLLHPGEFVSYELKSTPTINKTGFQFGNILTVVIRQPNSPAQNFSVILFTSIGKELLNLVNSEPEFKYLELFAKELKNTHTDVKYGQIMEIKEDIIRHSIPLVDFPEWG